MIRPLLASVLAAGLLAPVAHALSDAELDKIGRRIWKNECNGTRDGLTSWNTGENFASLGIGHFIWYPKGVDGPFEESFPKLVKFLGSNGVKTPAWLDGDCPWKTRAEFLAEFQGAKLKELRELLAGSVKLQSRFLVARMRGALPKIMTSAPPAERDKVWENFTRLEQSGPGTFALIDYVNFKGEGTNPKERYKGEGWGLMQVLATMSMTGDAAAEFAKAAAIVLERRVKNSPSERNEAKWLTGWKNRVHSYTE